MITLKSDDTFNSDGQQVFVIRRLYPRNKPDPKEIPIHGETVNLNGTERRVSSVEITRDTGMESWPCILVTVLG